MIDTMRAYLDRPIPRYTSYPTAAQFHPGITETVFQRWLRALDPAIPVSLYVHIPFCRKLCRYCGCNTNIVAAYEVVENFLDVLEQEIALTSVFPQGRLSYNHLHFGGGTPTIVTSDHFRRLCRSIDFHFLRRSDAELAIEIDPRSLTREMAAALAASGITRASLGVQDFNPAVQRAINRIQPFEVVAAAVAHLRHVGVPALNFDLIYGLPLQTVCGFLATVDKAVTLEPSRIALFGYAHVPWMKKHQKLLERYELPDTRLREELNDRARDRLREHGYVAIGLDHFARPDDRLARAAANGTLRRNFQGYTDDQARMLLAFGPSGISRTPQGYAQSHAAVDRWCEEISAGRLAISRGTKLSLDDRLRADVIEQLMCGHAVDLRAVSQRHGADVPERVFAAELTALQPFIDAGAVALSGDRLAITDAGRPYLRLVASAFDEYLASGNGRHSSVG